jgi:hypothetical protein
METSTLDRLEEIAEENDLDPVAFVGFCDNQHITADEAEDAINDFRDAYIGEFGSEEEFAEHWAEEVEALVTPTTSATTSTGRMCSTANCATTTTRSKATSSATSEAVGCGAGNRATPLC